MKECMTIVLGEERVSGSLLNTTVKIKTAADKPIYLVGTMTSVASGSSYLLKIDDRIIRDKTNLTPGKKSTYLNGLLHPGEELELTAYGSVTYEWNLREKGE